MERRRALYREDQLGGYSFEGGEGYGRTHIPPNGNGIVPLIFIDRGGGPSVGIGGGGGGAGHTGRARPADGEWIWTEQTGRPSGHARDLGN